MADALLVNEQVTIPGDELDVTYARSGGPGGQHVNTTDTRVRLRFALSRTTALVDEVKDRLRAAAGSWLTQDGDLLITCDTSRSRLQNLDEARERLANAIRAALVRPKRRRPTRPTRGSQVRRLETKKGRKQVKSGRGKIKEDT
jgi:ribosome-associated protein